jgi:hypothetical protein
MQHETPLPPGRCLQRGAAEGQPAGGGARGAKAWTTRDGRLRALDQPVGDHLPAAAHRAGADYRVRIFTPGGELPFAGHPTLGSCWAWLAAGGQPREDGVVVQQCGVGLVRIRRDGSGWPLRAAARAAAGRWKPTGSATIRARWACRVTCCTTSGWTTARAGAR